jgi:two-component system OmpR family sensor kinase/two-component system sensor histidine kinase BaeS
VTLLALIVAFSMSVIGMRNEVKRYVDTQFGPLPDSVNKQLSAYYGQSNEWDGVEVLLEDDFPLSVASVTIIDAEGRTVYDNRGGKVGRVLPSEEWQTMWPIAIDGEIVGYYVLEAPAAFRAGSPEDQLLEGLRNLLVVATLLATVVGLAVSGILTRSMTVPLQQLVEVSLAVAKGDLSQQVEEQGSDEIVQVARAFNEMTVALDKAEELRENLMADIAHELRTPLSVLQGNLRAILDDIYPLEKAEIARLYDETRLMSRLVDDLRELAQAEAGQLGLNLRTTDLAALLDGAIASFEPAAESKQIDLSLEVADALPTIEADPDRLAQVLRNLLTNALRHTPPSGQITVAAGIVSEHIQVSVADSGHGIAPQHLAHVFDRFWRADRARSREDGGSGLGLAIAKSLVEAHGGRIWIESVLGQGATSFFELPIGSES